MRKFLNHQLAGLVAVALGGVMMFAFKKENVGLTIAGLVLLMCGLYKTSKLTGNKPEQNPPNEKNIGHEE